MSPPDRVTGNATPPFAERGRPATQLSVAGSMPARRGRPGAERQDGRIQVADGQGADGDGADGQRAAERRRRGEDLAVKAIVADEWSVLRGGVAAVLAQCGVRTPRHAATATEAVAAAAEQPYELCVLGAVPDMAPATAIARLRDVRPELRLLVLLDGPSRSEAIEVLDAGADAVLGRNASEADLREAAVRLARGERYVSPALLATAFGSPPPEPVRDRFTERERSVLALLAEGRSNKEIADALFIGEATVKTHLRRIYEKLEVENRVQAVAAVHERRLLG